jgi:hypothetical protein
MIALLLINTTHAALRRSRDLRITKQKKRKSDNKKKKHGHSQTPLIITTNKTDAKRNSFTLWGKGKKKAKATS